MARRHIIKQVNEGEIMDKCPNCNKKLEPEFVFCPFCGHAVNSKSKKVNRKKRTKKKTVTDLNPPMTEYDEDEQYYSEGSEDCIADLVAEMFPGEMLPKDTEDIFPSHSLNDVTIEDIEKVYKCLARAILNQHVEISIFSSSDDEDILMVTLNKMLNTLSDRERETLELRFGLRDGRQRTLEEVGQYFGVTRERIRQLESKALRKLRVEEYLSQLRDYVVD